jgi:hypothetical protein
VSGETSKRQSLGSEWAMCALAKQHTGADDNDVQDGCWVSVESGNWVLTLSKHEQDWLRCAAVCLKL